MSGTDRIEFPNLEIVHAHIKTACEKVGRTADSVEIIGVTKTHGPDMIREAWDAGLRCFGENKVQEAAWKIPGCVSGPEWHMIGHLQRNKVRQALSLFSVIHSVDSLRLLEQIEQVAEEFGGAPEILLEVNVSGEASKDGLQPEQVAEVVQAACGLRHVTLTGLMTMAPFFPEPEQARPVFARLRILRDNLEQRHGVGLPKLSMGMSNDYLVAVEEGATWVRLGSILFGHVPKWKPQVESRWEP